MDGNYAALSFIHMQHRPKLGLEHSYIRNLDENGFIHTQYGVIIVKTGFRAQLYPKSR